MNKVRKKMCKTCPFRKGSKYACLAEYLAESALTESSRICHSTGSNNAINHQTGKSPMICRGARDLQLRLFYSVGFIKEPTDKAWTKKFEEMRLT
jgi:hypothetical protein